MRSTTALLGFFVLSCSTGVASAQQAEEEARPAAEPSALEGSWEGEFRGTRSPIFMTLHLRRELGSWDGSIDVLGRSLELQEVVPTDNGVRAILTPGPDGVSVEATLSGDRLEGVLIERGERFQMQLTRVPEYPTPPDRVEAWRQDLDALAERFLRADRSFSPARRELFLARVEQLRSVAPELDDSEIIMRMAGAVALSENTHTRLYLLRNRTELRRLPIRTWWFADGLHVVRATAAHRNLLGCRIETIGGVPARDARERVAAAFAGNPAWTDYKSVYYLTSPEALHGFGITSDLERVELGLSRCGDGPLRVVVEPLPLAKSDTPVEAWWDLSPAHRDGEWIQALRDSGREVPLYLRRPDRHYWFEYLPDPGALYFQYNRASEMADEAMEAFEGKLLAALDSLDVEALVVDLRFNTGGSLDLAEDLMAELEERTRARGIPRYLITGRATFSAGITHVAAWKEAGDVTVAGEAVGDELDFWSEGGNIVLPNSGFAAHFANAFHSYSEEPCPPDVPCFLDLSSPGVQPDLPVRDSWSEYLAGADGALEAVLADLRRAPER